MKDILLDQDGDLIIENGDFKIGYSDNQHQEHILKAEKGEYKEFPEVGVGISQMLSDDRYDEMMIEMKKQLQYDGMKIKTIRFEQDGQLIIDGKYSDNGQR
ncbi:oxidase [Zunongwangia profunda]|uniref:oxidase n=1 Tax=Zunongwangia profunda TaxID=398743 RepID=UPI00248E389E|nr:oxidase [Zunongwangia profunda]|tara:strand:- start:18205 stop:18507 length:303 start_codon:yes stop_codon:yes gene_type:complete